MQGSVPLLGVLDVDAQTGVQNKLQQGELAEVSRRVESGVAELTGNVQKQIIKKYIKTLENQLFGPNSSSQTVIIVLILSLFKLRTQY